MQCHFPSKENPTVQKIELYSNFQHCCLMIVWNYDGSEEMLHLLHSQDRDPYPWRPGTLCLLHLSGSSNRGPKEPFVPHEPVRQEPTDRWRSVYFVFGTFTTPVLYSKRGLFQTLKMKTFRGWLNSTRYVWQWIAFRQMDCVVISNLNFNRGIGFYLRSCRVSALFLGPSSSCLQSWCL